MTSPDLDSVVRVLQTYPGRDKAIRSLAFWLQLRAQTSDQKDAILALAKQLSSARLVLRQLNHPAMIKACKHLLHHKPTDHVSFFVLFQFLLHFIFHLLFLLPIFFFSAGLCLQCYRHWSLYRLRSRGTPRLADGCQIIELRLS